ncbi:outer membrane beta-barrel protein [Pseudoruegeria sp. SK021]|uniref:outer membrane beta-barrel protein n=1 Tax=Pseudoruegeria sp. SK021 TaxID=1933035 RepID=UPI000A263752|nr:outer membrane beta-barrel protein [Pseudoruegeria sp. SK021]OSP56881.1 lipid A oxidase [Pseudoruegeria sp. SK021]
MSRVWKLAAVLSVLAAGPALAEFELSVYTGVQTSPHSVVKGNDPSGIGDFDFTAGWEGKSLSMPPYYGIRGTWWRSATVGFGLEFNHAKVYADKDTLKDNDLETLEFTDGLNILTVNAFRRFPSEDRRWTPYIGGGVGISIPHVEFESTGEDTFNYQYGGPAVQWVAGVKYPLTETWSMFGEYKGTYSRNDVDLEGGGNLETNIVTNALNLGVSFNF